MKKKLKTIFVTLLTLLMVLSSAPMCLAEDEAYEGEEALLENILLPLDVIENEYPLTKAMQIICSGSFTKNSSTKATATIAYQCLEKANLTSTITLQVYSTSSQGYVNTSAEAAVQTVKNIARMDHRAVFKIAAGKKYRVKAVIKAVTNKGTSTDTFYRNMV